MMNCNELCLENEKICKKIIIKGRCVTECGNKTVLFDGSCLSNSYGVIRFENGGDCTVNIYKNNMDTPIATVVPGSCFVMLAKPLTRIVIDCHDKETGVDEIEKLIFKGWGKNVEICEDPCECCKCEKWYEETEKKLCCSRNRCCLEFDGYVCVQLDKLSKKKDM